ncbi:hypothetical protein SEA_LUCKYSOCKE_127 [Streptomyces phage LuckySocke]|jgi:phage pi2 protein 07|nr:hypothetical protein SEA_LUCKYSOCKE_127 [Streptomyces phage LuckySocke]
MAGVPVPDDMIVISKEEYEGLQKDRDFLYALEAAGVDNWEGYSQAWRFYEGVDDPEDY